VSRRRTKKMSFCGFHSPLKTVWIEENRAAFFIVSKHYYYFKIFICLFMKTFRGKNIVTGLD
jgi:hypothetical protein